MYSMIAQSFFQKKICLLPGLGTLELLTQAAETDFVNGKINAPTQKITFEQQHKKDTIFNEFSAISAVLLDEVNKNGQVKIDGLGTFIKKGTAISFDAQKLNSEFNPAVTAIRVQRENVEHDILVGDKQTTNVIMSEFFADETKTTKVYWWIWAAVLAALAIGVIGYYWIKNGFNYLENLQ
jgi:hypothetical protein